MKTIRLLVLITLAMRLSIVAADSSPAIPAVDTTNWKCKYCVVEGGWSGEIELGLGNVSHDSVKFGEYTGLNEKGGFFVGNANIYYRDLDASYLDLLVSDFGLDSRSLDIEAGIRGRYSLFLNYDEIPHFVTNSAKTPYAGNGTNSLDVPFGWVPASTTGTMTGLGFSLKSVDLETQRKRLGIGFSFTPDSPWGYDVKYRHETKEGIKRISGSFFLNAAQLAEPVDYVTDEVDASVSYNSKKWQASLAYYGSTFRNNNISLTWDNAFVPLVAGAVEGELALPPDNQFHQFILSGGYQLGKRSHLSGDIAIGRMEQDENFLPATLNTSLMVPVLPANSANAQVDTVDAKFKLMSMPVEKLRLSASYSYNDRDNKTPQLIYDWVTTDMLVATQRTNLPYSFTRSVVKLSADYQLVKRTSLGVGYEMESDERTFQEVDETEENTLWGRLRVRGIKSMFFELKLSQSERDTSTYKVVSDINPPQNTLLRKYNMADRVRNTVGMHINISPEPEYTIGLNIDIAKDDYDKSVLGLTESKEFSVNGDVTALLSESTSVNLFVGFEHIESTQAGSQTFSSADWLASNDDTVDSMGLGMTHVLIEDKLDIGADYTKIRSTGKIAIGSGAVVPTFPDLKTELDSFRLHANYHLKEMTTLRLAYWYERYDTDDWTHDGVLPDTIPNVLSFGDINPSSYDINVVQLSIVYKF